jgi:hypothetical protein
VSGLEVAVDISSRPEDVWQVVERLEDHVAWIHDAVAIRFLTEQHRGLGTSFLCDTKIGPITLVDHMEITEWTPCSAIGVRHLGVVTGIGRFTLTPIDLGRRTRFAWQESLQFPWWLGGRIGALIGGRVVLRPMWNRNLSTLKRLVESREAS